MKVTWEEMSEARVPLEFRDYCAHLLIPLNKCRYDNYYLPWKCEKERHAYEMCQYRDYKRRVALLEKEKKESKA